MRKNLLTLAYIIIISLCFHACGFSIPSGLEIIIDPELGVNMRSGDINGMIDKAIKEAVEGEEDRGISVLRYNGYNYSGNKQVQTFLIQYDVLNKEPLTFLADLDEVFDFELNLGDLSREIDVSDLANLDDAMEPSELSVDVTELIQKAVDKLNENNFETDFSLPIGIGDLASESIHEYDPFKMEGFTSVTFAQGTFSFELSYALDGVPETNICSVCNEFLHTIVLPGGIPSSICYCDIDFVFHDVIIKNDGGHPDIHAEAPVFFDTNIRDQVIEFNLAGYTLKNPRIILTGFDDNSAPEPKYVNVVITSNNPLSNPIVQGIEELELDDRIEVFLKIAGDPDYHPIMLDFGNSGFVHAKVGVGTINFKIDLPSDILPGETWVVFYDDNNEIDNKIDTEIYLLQDPADYTGDGTHYSGLSDSGSDTTPWKYTGGYSSLAGKDLNFHPEINVMTGSKITLPGGKVSFMLSDDGLATNLIEIYITPGIDIEVFSVVHIDPEKFLETKPLEPASIVNAVKYLKQIQFNSVGVRLYFGQIDIPGFEIMLTEPNLEINTTSTYCDIVGGGNSGDTFINTDYFWDVESSSVSALQFAFDLRKKGSLPGSKSVLDIQDLNLSNNKLLFQIDYEVYFNNKHDGIYDWEYAFVDLSDVGDDKVSGTYPAEDEAPIDMAYMFEYFKGFYFEEAKAYLYFNGPKRFFSLNPDITMEIDYDGYKIDGVPKFDLLVNPDDYINGFLNIDGKNSALLNLDPNGTGVYTGALPELNKTFEINIVDIMKDLPVDLRFAYDTALHNMRIEPWQIEKDSSSALNELNAVMLMVLPMIIKAGEDGADLKIQNLFAGMDDIFGRSMSGDSPYLDFIKDLTVRIQLPEKVFSGGTFFMTEASEIDTKNELLSFPLRDGRSQEFVIDGSKLEHINKTFPYKIIDMGIRFPEGAILEIPNNLDAVKVEVDANIHYELEW